MNSKTWRLYDCIHECRPSAFLCSVLQLNSLVTQQEMVQLQIMILPLSQIACLFWIPCILHAKNNMFMRILFEKDLHHFFLLNERFKFGVNFWKKFLLIHYFSHAKCTVFQKGKQFGTEGVLTYDIKANKWWFTPLMGGWSVLLRM